MKMMMVKEEDRGARRVGEGSWRRKERKRSRSRIDEEGEEREE